MTKEELIKYLVINENKNLVLNLEGIVSLNLQIDRAIIEYSEDYLSIQDKENSLLKIKFNLHQLMKINKLENYLELRFEQLQIVYITIKEEVF